MRVVPAGPEALEEAARILGGDGIVVLPTDTVYGLAVRGDRPGAVSALAAAKGRSADQPVALLVTSLEQAHSVAVLGEQATALATELWPGPLTLVLPRRSVEPLELGGVETTVGVRWPDDDFVTELARRVGPLAVTSANRHGHPTAPTAEAAAAGLIDPVDLVVDRGVCAGRPSTVVALTDDRPAVLRPGAVGTERIEAIVGTS